MTLRNTLRLATTPAKRSLKTLMLAGALAIALPSAARAQCGPGDTGACDDGRACTTNDHCEEGLCAGELPAVPASCDWAIVHGNETHDSSTRAANDTTIGGSICGQAIRIQHGTTIDGDVVSTMASSVRIASEVAVSGRVLFPSLQTPMEAGSMLGDCDEAIAGVVPTIKALDSKAFPFTTDAGNVKIASHGDFTITATDTLNVIDFSSLVADDGATITLDGNAIPNATFVLRVNRKLYLHYGSSIVLAGGAAPERVILYGREECRFGREVVGAGTVFCPYDSIRLGQSSQWTGALVGGGDRIELREHVEIIHVPSEVPLLD
jgi:hypothetical protein